MLYKCSTFHLQGVGAYKSVNQTIQRLEEAAVSCRGHERALLITRWLTVLKEIDRASGTSVKDKDMSSEERLDSDEAKRREWVFFLFPFIFLVSSCILVYNEYYLSIFDCYP